MSTSQDFANWVCGDELDPELLMYALIRSRDYLRSLASGATHKTIYMPTLEQLQICAPPRAEQERIVRRLKAQLACAEETRIAASAQLAEIERLSGRILAHAFGDAESPAELTNGCERLIDRPEDDFSDGRDDPPRLVRKLAGLDG